jgi:hypothetical protein
VDEYNGDAMMVLDTGGIGCYTVVTLLLHCCYTAVALFLHFVTILLHWFETVVTRLSQV